MKPMSKLRLNLCRDGRAVVQVDVSMEYVGCV